MLISCSAIRVGFEVDINSNSAAVHLLSGGAVVDKVKGCKPCPLKG